MNPDLPYRNAPEAPEILDTLRTIETPEGVELALRVAGPIPRAAAWLVDFTIKSGALLLAMIILPLLGEFGTGLLLVLMFAAFWVYGVLFEVLGNGATPGKRALRLRVVYRDGTPVGWTGSVIRNLLRAVDALPFCYGVGLLAALPGKNFQRLGDLAADTLVVHQETAPTGSVVNEQAARPLGVPLRPEDQYAILLFSERSRSLSGERSIELADILAGRVTSGGQKGVDELNAHANWAAGRR